LNVGPALFVSAEAVKVSILGAHVRSLNPVRFQVEEVRPLLRSPLVDGEAYDTTSQLAQCVSPPLRYLAYDIATALKLVTTAPALVVGQLAGPVGKGKQQPSTVERVTAGLVAATREGPLPTPTFGFVWPVRGVTGKTKPAGRMEVWWSQ
jgi:hypothetical protein